MSKWWMSLMVLGLGCGPRQVELSAGASLDPGSSESEGEWASPEDPPHDPSTSGGGGTFVSSDMASACGELCDPWADAECGPGSKCAPVACEVGSAVWDSTVCKPVLGDKQPGEPCTVFDSATDGIDDCAAGSFCWDPMRDTGIGRCVSWCTGSPSIPGCDQPNHVCNVWKSLGQGMCTPLCDPRNTDECPVGCMCLPTPSDEGFTCILNASGDVAPYGTPCDFANACNPGLLCMAGEIVPVEACESASGCCSPVCDLAVDEPCPGAAGGQECVPFYEPGMTPTGYEDIGVCAVPS
jgi:hypothetical protein